MKRLHKVILLILIVIVLAVILYPFVVKEEPRLSYQGWPDGPAPPTPSAPKPPSALGSVQGFDPLCFNICRNGLKQCTDGCYAKLEPAGGETCFNDECVSAYDECRKSCIFWIV